jgi:hypothetical protein
MIVAMGQSRSKSLQKLIEAIEGHELAVDLGVASSRTLYREILSNHPRVLELTRLLAGGPEFAERIFERVCAIASLSHDPRYANPLDTALSAYLWALWESQFGSNELARLAATRVLKSNDSWWSREIALEILLQEQSTPVRKSQKVFISYDIGPAAAEFPSLLHFAWASESKKNDEWIPTDFSSALSHEEFKVVSSSVDVRYFKFKPAHFEWSSNDNYQQSLAPLATRTSINSQIDWES